MNEFMKAALDEAYDGIRNGDGGPFGAVVVRNGEIIGRGHNCVLKCGDPTHHGEIAAIRDACAKLGTHDLSGCELYTTAEPCPMCLGAVMWANIETVYYGCTTADTAKIGFRDEKFYNTLRSRGISMNCCERDACLELFGEYASRDREIY